MGGEVKDFRVGIKGILSPIAMVDVKVNNKNTAEVEVSQGILSRDSHIVENAEP
ncbi:unnamed protein product, partial [marine sediment metagenome]